MRPQWETFLNPWGRFYRWQVQKCQSKNTVKERPIRYPCYISIVVLVQCKQSQSHGKVLPCFALTDTLRVPLISAVAGKTKKRLEKAREVEMYVIQTATEPATTKWWGKERWESGKIFGTLPLRTLGNAHFK